MVVYIQPFVTLLLITFSIFCVVGHLTFFQIYFNYVNFGQRVQDFLYTRQGAQTCVFTHAHRK